MEAGFDPRYGDQMHNSFWGIDNRRQRDFFHEVPRGRGYNGKSSNRGYKNQTGGSTKSASRGDKKENRPEDSKENDKKDEEVTTQDKVKIGEKLEREGKFLFKFPESEEDKRKISGSVNKFLEDVKCELGDQTFIEMFATGESKVGSEDPKIPMGGAQPPKPPTGGAIGTRPKNTYENPYDSSALGRLQFFVDDGVQGDSDSGKGSPDTRNVNAASIEDLLKKGEEELYTSKRSAGFSGSSSNPRQMTEIEKAMVNSVIDDILNGRTEDGDKLWVDIRDRLITDSQALDYLSQFYRRQCNECISKIQAEYCLQTLRSTFPVYEEDENDKTNELEVDHLIENETLNKFIKLAYNGDKEEARNAMLKKSRGSCNESQDIVPKELKDFQLGSFTSMEDYMDYMQEVTKGMLENVAVVEEKCKVNAINDRKKLKERREMQRDVTNRPSQVQIEPPMSCQRTNASKRVDFNPTLRNQRDGTYNVGRSGISDRPTGYSSTPNAPRAGVMHNHNDSSILQDNMGLTARELSIYEQYHVPPELRRSTRMTEASSPVLSSTMAGDQPYGNMQSLFTMVPTGSSLDMFRKFSGRKCEFLEWKHETQILLRNFPEELRVIKLKSLLKEEHKCLVGHIFHDDVNATESMWKVLTANFGGSSKMADYHMDQLTGWMRDGKKCKDYESLSHLYNFIKRHYYGMARLGAEKIPMAESFAYAIAPLLYGKSQREVNKLKHKDSFNVSKILDIIADHAAEVKDQEEDCEKYAHRSDQYSEEDRKFLRDRYFEEHGYKRYNRKDKFGHREDRSISRGRYQSKDRYRNDSRDSRNSSRYPSKYPEDRSLSRSRDHQYSGDQKAYYKKNRARSIERSKESVSKGDQEAVVLKAEEQLHSTEISHGKEPRRYRRDQTPRGSRSKSPLRRSGSRSWNSWRCSLCLSDDHKTINCHKFSAEEVMRLCEERKLCYVCNLSGHVSSVCNAECLLCKSSGCTQDVNHNHLLCAKFKKP